MAELVTVRYYPDVNEALVARSMLESSGIATYLCDQNFYTLGYGRANLHNGIRLQVEREDAADAEEILSTSVTIDAPDAPSAS